MRFPAPRRRSIGEPVIPLINIVFLLLIFFMLAGTLTPPEPFSVEPPQSERGEGADARLEGVILLGPDGAIAFEGETLEGGDEALRAVVGRRIEAEADLELQLRADGAASATRVMDVMDRLREAGAERVRLITVRAEEG